MTDYTIFTHSGLGAQVPDFTNANNPPGAHVLGERFTMGSAGYEATYLHYYLPAGKLANNTTVLAQLWNETTATRLVEIDLKSAAVSGYIPVSGWMSVPITPATTSDPKPTLNTTDTYFVGHFVDGSPGEYVYTNVGLYPLTNGPLSASTAEYRNGGTHNDPPNTTFGGYFFADLTVSPLVTGVSVTGTGAATGTGVANAATALLGLNAGSASATGTAFGAAGQISTNGAGSAASGAANGATALLATSAGVAAAGGTGFGAAGQVATNGAGSAASGDALGAAASLAASAGAGLGTGAAFGPAPLVGPSPSVALGSGQAFPPTLSGTDIINPVTSTYFGPCEWDSVACTTWPTGSESVTGIARRAATESLWQASGQRYGLCEYTIRPCRRDCFGSGWPFWGGSWWEWTGQTTWPQPILYAGNWYNLTCGGGCGDSCSCFVLEEVYLPSPVAAVTQVLIDGAVMPTGSYMLQDYRKLVRTDGGMWPACQDLSQPDTAENTWSITLQVGEVVPYGGQMALGQLEVEYARACMGMDCQLPAHLQSLARQGVSISFDPKDTFLDKLPLVREFLRYANPNRLYVRPTVTNVDNPRYRVDNV